MFAMKVTFSSFLLSFSVNILPVLKFVAFTWCFEWVVAVQTILRQFSKYIPKSESYNISDKSALSSLNNMPYIVKCL